MNAKGKYDTVEFRTNNLEDLKYLYNVAMGELSLRKTTEVDCDYLFGRSGHIYHPNCSKTTVETFDILVIEKHQIDRVYCCPGKLEMNSLSNGRVRIGMRGKIHMIFPFGNSIKRDI